MQTEDADFLAGWLAHILNAVDRQLPGESKASLVKGCAEAHYRLIHMDEQLAPYQGNLPAFLDFIATAWGWKIDYNPAEGLITADENKAACICPLVRVEVVKDQPPSANPLLCNCSEGFAERMFSSVLGQPVQARVVRSILKGDPSCVYQVKIPANALK